jgi:cathepsin X
MSVYKVVVVVLLISILTLCIWIAVSSSSSACNAASTTSGSSRVSTARQLKDDMTCGQAGSVPNSQGPNMLKGGKPGKRKSEVKKLATVKHVPRKLRGRPNCTDTLPKAWDWRNVPAVNARNLPPGNYCTKMLNQHIPVYCGSCWAHGALSSVADRMEIHKRMHGVGGPQINLSVQVILNCAKDIAGSCEGGDSLGVFQYMHQTGVPSDTCQPYSATDGHACIAINICRSCAAGPSFQNDVTDSVCCAVSNPKLYKVSAYGSTAKDVDAIMMEIYCHGPVAAGINANPIVEYTSGIVTDDSTGDIDHIVSIVGWGEERGVKFWIVRNSWGTYYGEDGFVKIQQGKLRIEEEVTWADPIMS